MVNRPEEQVSVTRQLARVPVDVILMIVSVLAGLFAAGSGIVGAIAGVSQAELGGILVGIVMLILSPFITLLYVIFARVYMESIIVIFRIAENISELNHKTASR